jgi:hypothetical protein
LHQRTLERWNFVLAEFEPHDGLKATLGHLFFNQFPETIVPLLLQCDVGVPENAKQHRGRRSGQYRAMPPLESAAAHPAMWVSRTHFVLATSSARQRFGHPKQPNFSRLPRRDTHSHA